MQAEHETEGAREQLASGWKAWLAERCGEAAGAEPGCRRRQAVQGGDTIEAECWADSDGMRVDELTPSAIQTLTI